jgi:hypothetical protein
MPKEWNDDDVKAEIAAAIAIVREDRFEAFVRTKLPPSPNDPNGGNGKSGDGGNGGGNAGDSPKGKKSLWWGETE